MGQLSSWTPGWLGGGGHRDAEGLEHVGTTQSQSQRSSMRVATASDDPRMVVLTGRSQGSLGFMPEHEGDKERPGGEPGYTYYGM